ncbi:laminin subunit beta-1-like isoform X2 [Montipora foliosa]
MRNATATSTCGTPASGYCELGPGQKCYECDANSTTKKHLPEFMVNSEFDTPYLLGQVTWWQSQTWWDVYSQNPDSPPKVNITLSLGRSFHISGRITVRFYNRRPKEMFLEKSKDSGKTWSVLQYFAFDCENSYNMPALPPVIKSSPFNVSCTEYYSGTLPPRFGIVEFRFDSRYDPGCGYFDPDVQDFMLATNVRVRLEEPPSLDDIGLLFPTEENLNKYYYAISDIIITGRCNCNGHAQYCRGPRMDETCVCEHNAAGKDCEMCKPLYNNRPWMPANATHANECQECQCNSHGMSCLYNNTLNIGVCSHCKHNTTGQHCEKCQSKFYRNSDVPIDHPNTCVACNCFPEGITNNGSCLQESTSTQVAGQCHCKNDVMGQQCNLCTPGYWGLTLSPRGECIECGCNSLGTVNSTIECDQYTGTCMCKLNIQGTNCSECKDGFYHFPLTNGTDCQQCPCDFGGAFPICNKSSGLCTCRSGVEGTTCNRAQQGQFYPFLDFVILEGEDMHGTFTSVTEYDGRGVAFTGSGYASFFPGQYAFTNASNILASYHYYAVIRYSVHSSYTSGPEARLTLKVEAISFNESSEFNIFLEQLPSGSQQAWMSQDTVKLFAGETYNISLFYNSSGDYNYPFLVDSIVLIPDLSLTRVFTESGQDIRNHLQSCVQARASLPHVEPEPAYCSALMFSVSAELYNGTLECGCNAFGTVAGSYNCTSYGGQCSCRLGVVGRTCNLCGVGFYRFSSAGCDPCECSNAGSVETACHELTGQCHCKVNVEGLKCNSCKPGTFNLDSANQQGCLNCFGYGRAVSCTSANGFVASTITSDFVNETVFKWTVVNSTGSPVEFAVKSSNGMVVTSTASRSVLYIEAPSSFLGSQFRSYGQRLHVNMEMRDLSDGHSSTVANGDVILSSGSKEVMLNFAPSASSNVTSYHVILDENHMVNGAITSLEFQSILAKLTSLRIRATYHDIPRFTRRSTNHSLPNVTFKKITLETAVKGLGSPGEMRVGFVENSTCHMNYTGLSCERCALGFTREVNGSGKFGRCVLCSCNNRSTQCHGETGVCINCKVGTYGDRCQLCAKNVQGPDCSRCQTGYWGLSENGCQACHCYTPGTTLGNDTSCDQLTGQCNCNATANVRGRRCDTCKENSWRTSAGLLSCKECPSCYSSVQEDVNLLRVHITSLKAEFSSFLKESSMLHNSTFVERFYQLVTDVRELTQTIHTAQEADVNSTAQWLLFSVVVNELSAVINETVTKAVNQTLHSTAILEAHRRDSESIVSQIHDLVTEAFLLLETSIERGLGRMETSAVSLANIARQLLNMRYSIDLEANRTVVANETVYSRLEHAVAVATKSVELARNVTDTQAHVNALLSQLHGNASEVHDLGETTVAIASTKLEMASRAYNHSLQKLDEAKQANPDRSIVLEDVKSESAIAGNLSSQFHSQVSKLYQSGTAVIDQIKDAVQTAISQVNDVQTAYSNGSQIHQDSQVALVAARAAVLRANRVHSDAQRMLQVLRNFEDESLQAQSSASEALSVIPHLRNNSHQIIREVSMVNESSANTLRTASEALKLGRSVYNISSSEKKVLERTLHLASQLHNETSAKNAAINNTVENFIAAEIEPVMRLCQNASTVATNVSEYSSTLLKRAAHLNASAHRLNALIRQLRNESSHLPRVNVNNLSVLRREVISAKEQFLALQLGPHLAELREGIHLQKEKMTLFKDWIGQLRSSIDERKNLLRSMPSETPC